MRKNQSKSRKEIISDKPTEVVIRTLNPKTGEVKKNIFKLDANESLVYNERKNEKGTLFWSKLAGLFGFRTENFVPNAKERERLKKSETEIEKQRNQTTIPRILSKDEIESYASRFVKKKKRGKEPEL